MKVYVYIRNSKSKEIVDRQLETITQHTIYNPTPIYNESGELIDININDDNVDFIFDNVTPYDERTDDGVKYIMKSLQAGDILIVEQFSIISHDKILLLELANILWKNPDIEFISLRDNFNSLNPEDKKLIEVASMMYRYETSKIDDEFLDKRDSNINLSPVGRKPIHDHEAILKDYMENHDMNYRDIAKKYNVSLRTITQVMQKYNVDTKTRTFKTDIEN